MKILLLGCTVCYGDPASPLSKGAAMGVIVLGIAILCVLGAFTTLFLFWMKRARALEAQQNAQASASERSLPLSPVTHP